jgi:hypothetical protein
MRDLNSTIGTNHCKIIQEELDLEIQRIYYWTDSMSLLKARDSTPLNPTA